MLMDTVLGFPGLSHAFTCYGDVPLTVRDATCFGLSFLVG